MLSRLRKKKEGFTLIELMIVVAIIGVLAAIAIPAFINYVKKSKTSETGANLKGLYQGASSYYAEERYMQGLATGTAASSTHCTVAETTTSGITPTNAKQDVPTPLADSYTALKFALADPVYYDYRIDSGPGDMCGNSPGNTMVYTFRAVGDLDGDGVMSTFEMAVGSDEENSLYRAPGIYTINELE